MNDDYTVYMYTNTMTGKKYIGQTRLTKEQRAGNNGENYKVCPRFWKAIKEYGWETFDYKVIEDKLYRPEAESVERFYIELYQTTNPKFGYNIQVGGRRLFKQDNMFYGKTHDFETRNKVSESNKSRIWSEESKKKIKDKLSGGNSPRSVKVVCVETNMVYDSITQAAQAAGTSKQKISNVLHGWRKTAGGFHWEYYTS